MDKKQYDKVGIVSVLLKEKLQELEECQKEKEDILKEIDKLSKMNQLEENYPKIKEKMEDNLKHFEQVVDEIKKINDII